jgi:hypothetical protein
MKQRRYFTWAEANALVPRLAQIFGTVQQLRTQLRATYDKLERLGAPPSEDNLGAEGPPEVMRLRGLFQGLYETLADELREVTELGGEVKDIDRGLVDFHYRRDGEDVLLCWRYGEDSIAYWHSLEGGYAARQPVEDRDREVPRTLH